MPRKNKKTSYISILKQHKVIAFLIGFAIIGSLIVIARAATTVSEELFASSNLAYSYSEGGAVTLERDSNGKVMSYSRPRAIDVSKDGYLYCTPANKSDITYRALTNQEINFLTNDLFYARPSQIKDPAENEAYIGNEPTVYIDGFNPKINGASFTESGYPQLVNEAATQFEKLCEIPGETIPSGDSLEIILSEAKSKGAKWYQSVAEILAPSVFAGGVPSGSGVNYLAVNGDHEAYQHVLMANARKANGMPATQATSCLNSAARDWTKVMAILGYIRHSDNIVERPVKYCGEGWTFAGENVGVSSLVAPNNKDASEKSSRDVFQAFMNSPGHRANILQRKFTHHGVGSYTSSDGKRVFVTQVFWQGKALPK